MRTICESLCRAALAIACLATLVDISPGAEPNDVISARQLEAVGLAGMATITDEQGALVRGSGGRAGGFSLAFNFSGTFPTFDFSQYSQLGATAGSGTSTARAFPGTLIGLIFGTTSGTPNFGAGGSSFWGF